jgi:TPR repeat protein
MKYIHLILIAIILATTSCKPDDKDLFNELTDIASSGNPEAQYHLGMLYNNGIGTNKDTAKAFELFQKSSSGGDPLGSYKLGCYYSGQGEGVVEKDQNKALEYKLTAAEAGYVRAQYDVAARYYHNNDMVNAISWWEKAANQGYSEAFYSLFSVYYYDKNNTKDWYKAYQYLKIMERNIGNDKKKEVEEKLAEIEPTLSQDQLDQALSFVKNFKPQKSELTIKAYAGKKECFELVKQFKEKKL